MSISWDVYFIRQAMTVALKSKDPSTKVGCVIVGPDHEHISSGFNGFPRGVKEDVDECQPFESGVTYPAGSERFMGGLNLETHMVRYPPVLMESRWYTDDKYKYVEHAERNAVYNAARIGVPLKGCVAYLNWAPQPCIECTKALIQSGIVCIVGPAIPFGGKSNRWKDDLVFAETMLDEAGVLRREVSINQRGSDQDEQEDWLWQHPTT